MQGAIGRGICHYSATPVVLPVPVLGAFVTAVRRSIEIGCKSKHHDWTTS